MSVRLAWFILLGLHALPVAAGLRVGWGSGLMCMFFLHLVLLATMFIPRLDPWRATLRKFRTSEKQVCITIDDGPTADTDEILSILDEAGARAVFFVIGERVTERCSEIVKRGHVLGNHTQTHPAGWFWCYSPSAQRREIERAARAIREATGVSVRLFRPPVGFRNLFNAPILETLGLRNIGWSARGFDATDSNVERVLRRILGGLEPGAIILLHQGKPHHATLLRRLLVELKAGGWDVVMPTCFE